MGVVGCKVGVPGAVIVLSVNVSAELEAVIGCWGTDRKCPSWQESTEEERRDDLSAS